MAIDINTILSDNARNMRRSPVRALLSRANVSQLISFAGGYPNQETFLVDELKDIVREVLENDAAAALQYGPTEGNRKLRELLAERYKAMGLDITYENVIITTASQQALDLCSRIFLNPGDTLICGLPSYLGALQSFWACSAEPVGVRECDDMEEIVKKLISAGKKPKFIYTIPDFSNPSGLTLTLEQRRQLIAIAVKYDLIVIEDSPYRELRFEGEELPLIASLDSERVILTGTFSKTFVPGFRLGWVIAPLNIIDKLVVAKQSADLCSSVFDQALAVKYMERGLFEANIRSNIDYYRKRRDIMLSLFDRYMPEGVSWTKPEGGLFLFVTLPEKCDAMELFNICLDRNLAFVAGEIFHCDGSGKNTLRINYSYVEESKMEQGVQILSDSIRLRRSKW